MCLTCCTCRCVLLTYHTCVMLRGGCSGCTLGGLRGARGCPPSCGPLPSAPHKVPWLTAHKSNCAPGVLANCVHKSPPHHTKMCLTPFLPPPSPTPQMCPSTPPSLPRPCTRYSRLPLPNRIQLQLPTRPAWIQMMRMRSWRTWTWTPWWRSSSSSIRGMPGPCCHHHSSGRVPEGPCCHPHRRNRGMDLRLLPAPEWVEPPPGLRALVLEP